MHYRLFVTFEKSEAETSQEARHYVYQTLLEDASFIGGGRFSPAFCDWFVIGGRWSGELSRATWAKSVQKQIDTLEKTAGARVWGAYYFSQEKKERQAELKAQVEALYAKAIPEVYKDKGLVFARDTYADYGYEDDAMIITESLYEAFLVGHEGKDMAVIDGILSFVDLDYDLVSRDFVGQKWLVVVDAHI